ncbi:polymer-forming cytoskeletal protein [Dokdonella soli]|uniref:Polymer-forming cytoskeletal protein n=1 Tax=Dokdonella soli TaxID=529810 RepID=A0ABP3TJ41_9GAMM
MAIFNQQPAAKKETFAFPQDPAPAPIKETPAVTDYAAPPSPSHKISERSDAKESLIASDITIEGKIEGSGHVRIAGKFKGDVNVQGDLTIEKDAKLNGSVRAKRVTIAGELEGNIEAASQVDLQQSGVLIGDLKAASLTVAAGSRMRGQVEFGWDDKTSAKPGHRNGSENGAAA